MPERSFAAPTLNNHPMKTLKIYPNNINTRYIEEAVEALADGKAIIYPTDSLYAIGCDATNQRAIERVCRFKGINPDKQHLAILCSDMGQAARFARIDNNAFDIMRRNLPGAFTFILPAASTLPKAFKGRKEVGVRIPDDEVARKLAEELGRPLLTTSLYIDDIDTDDSHLATMEIADRYSSDAALMIDSGARGNIPSTVVDLTDPTDPQILRQGKATLQP